MNRIILATALASLFAMQTGYAEKTAQSELDILSAEADEAATEKMQSPSVVVEPEVEATSDVDIEKLSETVTSQLSKILGESRGDAIDTETEDKIEKVISSSLLSGAELNDIKSAVNSAMDDLKSEEGSEISDEKITNAAKSIDKLVGTEKKTDEAEDSYLSSLLAEADEVDESASIKGTPKPEVKAAPVVKNEVEKPKQVAVTTEPKGISDAVTPKTSTETIAESFLNAETVTVLKGESLYKIALRVYGNGGMFAKLYEANKETIIDPNLIAVGQVLKVPR